MNIFRKIFQRKEKKLEIPDFWEVSSPGRNPDFFKQLNIFLPENSLVYAESLYDKEVQKLLGEISKDCETILPNGTLWPRPKVFHIPATDENLLKIASIAEDHLISVHFHAYKGNEFILMWYDAFEKDPVYVSKAISEEKIKKFCKNLDLTYREEEKD